MPLTEDQLMWVRSYVGDAPPSDEALDEIFARLSGSVASTVEEVLRKRLADLLRQPASVTITGKLSVNRSANIQALQKQLEAFLILFPASIRPRVLPVSLPAEPRVECYPWGQPAIMRGRAMP